ncbi:MAG TPA: helix-turn-helix transcriptional regulator [Acidimicrobiia bacterium]
MVGSPKPQAQHPVDWADIGALITEQRQHLGLSTTDAARRARVSNSTWRKIEAGQNQHPTDETLVRIARTLRFEPTEMMARCGRRYADIPTIREVVPVGAPLDLLQVLECDGRLDVRSRRLLMELYEALASR